MQRNSRMGTIITALEAERDNINTALEALGRKGPTNAQGQRATGRRRRHMSPEARARISKMMKLRWTERKRKARAA